jgi:murein DD-endopeptidase MepM/ murein hydrolase activator NlpD
MDSLENNVRNYTKKAANSIIQNTIKVAGRAFAFLLKQIALWLGIPFGILAVIAVIGAVIFFSIYGALPAQVNEDNAKPRYEEAIKNHSPEIISDDGVEKQYMLTWGILAAIDYKKRMLLSTGPDYALAYSGDKIAKKLAPEFKYKDATKKIVKTVIGKDGQEYKITTEVPIKLVSEVNTYKGIYKLYYEKKTFDEGDEEITKYVLSRTEYTEDWSRLIKVIEDEGIPADENAAYLMDKTGLAIESGAPYFSWVTESEDEMWISGSVGWDWGSGEFVPAEYVEYFEEAAKETGLDVSLLEAVAAVESEFNPNAVSPAGALGIMQLMPYTVKELGISDPFDPRENILGGAKYLKTLVDRFGKTDIALAAYNAGAGNVEKYGGIPPFEETQEYVSKVMNLWKTGIPVWNNDFYAPVKGEITSPFGERIHPITKKQSFHSGIDIAAPIGTPVKAAKDGRVKFADEAGLYGLTVILDHGNGLTTVYGHCFQLNVRQGDEVKKGDVIALVGSTGLSTGPHLHFEIRLNGKPINSAGYF